MGVEILFRIRYSSVTIDHDCIKGKGIAMKSRNVKIVLSGIAFLLVMAVIIFVVRMCSNGEVSHGKPVQVDVHKVNELTLDQAGFHDFHVINSPKVGQLSVLAELDWRYWERSENYVKGFVSPHSTDDPQVIAKSIMSEHKPTNLVFVATLGGQSLHVLQKEWDQDLQHALETQHSGSDDENENGSTRTYEVSIDGVKGMFKETRIFHKHGWPPELIQCIMLFDGRIASLGYTNQDPHSGSMLNELKTLVRSFAP